MNRLLELVKEELNQNTGITTVSFDIFDTVLFRMVAKPVDIFENVACIAKKRGVLSGDLFETEYKNIRIEAEKKARKARQKMTGESEVSLEDIMKQIPEFIGDSDALAELEMETEQRYCYLNPDFLEVLDCLVYLNEKVIFVSDMYFSADQIKFLFHDQPEVLENIAKIYVSSEYGVDKKSGNLFELVLQEEQIASGMLLHIGDNYVSDVVKAAEKGIRAVWYSVISDDTQAGLHLENLKYGNLEGKILSLRKYVAQKHNGLICEDLFWYQLGAVFLGPFLTMATEWALDIAEREKIYRIFPLMREGKLLAELLKRSAEKRKDDFTIQAMYVSRAALLIPSLSTWNEESYDKIMRIKGATVGTVLSLFSLDHSELKQNEDVRLQDLLGSRLSRRQNDLANKLHDYLFEDHIVEKIDRVIRNATNDFTEYLHAIGACESYITFDLGVRGTMQEDLYHIYQKQDISCRIENLLLFASYDIVEKLLNGVHIIAYAGAGGAHADLVEYFVQNPYIWEQMMMCPGGTTTGYQRIGNEVTPVTKETIADEKHFYKIALCQKGVLAFQEEYLKFAYRNGEYKRIDCDAGMLARMFMRVIDFPTPEEAKYIGSLSFDENYGRDAVEPMCSPNELQKVKEMGPERYVDQIIPGDVPWVEGLIVQNRPEYYVEKLADTNFSYYDRALFRMVQSALNRGIRHINVVGAGEAGRALKKYLDLYAVQVECFIDNNESLHGTVLDGIEVVGMNMPHASEVYMIASFAFAEEITKQIQREKGETAVIISALQQRQ